MKIYVKNARKHGVSKRDITSAAKFYGMQLFTPNMYDKINLFIDLDDDLDFAGLCTWYDDPVRPKEFLISLHPWAEDDILQTLAHEMVHARQYASGTLKELVSVEDTVNWQGTRYKVDNYEKNYSKDPWEVEAYAMEKILYHQYLAG